MPDKLKKVELHQIGDIAQKAHPENEGMGIHEKVSHLFQIFGVVLEVLNEHSQVLISAQVFLVLKIDSHKNTTLQKYACVHH